MNKSFAASLVAILCILTAVCPGQNVLFCKESETTVVRDRKENISPGVRGPNVQTG